MSEQQRVDDARSGEEATPDSWAVVELMGHVRLAGRLTEEERFGTKMGRLDVPHGDGFVTQYFGGSSVYRITPVSEAVARHVAKSSSPAPVGAWDFPKQLPAASTYGARNDGPDSDHEEGPEDDDKLFWPRG